jgi:hypothetical protein
MVALGHWLLTGITQQGGHLSGLDALDYVSWGRWVTLLSQVMPVFFLTASFSTASMNCWRWPPGGCSGGNRATSRTASRPQALDSAAHARIA